MCLFLYFLHRPAKHFGLFKNRDGLIVTTCRSREVCLFSGHYGDVLIEEPTIVIALYVNWQLKRVQSGILFAFPLAFDAPATAVEIEDAQASARDLVLPATLVVVVMGILFFVLLSRRDKLKPLTGSHWKFAAIACVLASIIDCISTVYSFHTKGIEFELHPGIRLFGYAYGRTIGPILGKTVQTVGLLIVARLNERTGFVLLYAVSIVYLLSALHNVSNG